ncbi:TPA: hypothetical protein ACPOMA_000362 [Haemophilus influenzae]
MNPLKKLFKLGSYQAKSSKARDLYEKGDKLSAIMLLNQNAEAGYPSSQADLAVAYFYGDGVQQDWSKAFYWYSETYRSININNSDDVFVTFDFSEHL